MGKNVVIFELDINLSVYIDNKGKDTLILAKGPTQGLTLFPLGAAQSARATFNFSRKRKKDFFFNLQNKVYITFKLD